jgi:hypothetical protein
VCINFNELKPIVELFTQNDLTEIIHLQPDGWSDILPFYNFYIKTNFCYPIKIKIEDKIAGIGVAILHEDTAWLAHIIVHINHRNKGLGSVITQSLIDFVMKKQYKTILLIATKLGESVYSKLGFEKETEYINFKQEEPLIINDNSIAFNAIFQQQILALDEQISGEQRKQLLLPHLPHAKLIIENNLVRAAYLPTLGEGAIIADNEEAGIKLLNIKHTAIRRTAMPIDNKVGCDFLFNNGFTEVFRGTRMFLGKRIKTKFENNYSRIGGNLG